ncbi:hypothetical protein [Thiothrix sp.]|uniref:hypothetical protein n=1 Tax=Thiothrix sp. TaxID=1032 RepID=UPI00257FF8E9|nr:hypothetical protein [Thiothrix sp.]
MKNILGGSVLCVALVACAAPGVSPENANLLEAMGNLQTGEFDRQLQRKQLDLDASRTVVAGEQQRQNNLQTTLADKQQELAMLKAELADVKQQNLALEDLISRQQAKTKQQQEKRKEMLSKVSAINKEIATIEAARAALAAQKPLAAVNASKPVTVEESEYHKRVTELAEAGEYRKRVVALKQEVRALQTMAAANVAGN